MSKLAIAVVADDLTGAADTGVGFLRAGFSTVVAWRGPEDAALPRLDGEVDVLALDTGTRYSLPAEARAIVARMAASLQAAGVPALYKKVDSTLRGNVGEEVAAIVESWQPRALVVFAPAFPATGRTTIGGRVCVHGVPLEQPALDELLGRAGIATDLLTLDCVRSASLAERFECCSRAGVAAVACDVETDDDLERIARAGAACASGPIWVGSGGLARALAANLRAARGRPSASSAHTPQLASAASVRPVNKPILIVVGSATRVAREQAANLAASGAALHVMAIASLAADGAAAVDLDRILAHLRAGTDVVVTLGDTLDRDSAAVGIGHNEYLTTSLGRALRPCEALVGAVIATGGDTASGILEQWNVRALRLADEVEPGVPVSLTVGQDTIPIVTKAGAFGGETTLSDARAWLKKVP
jgi:D-threonate/D-erythronate kinase